MELPNQIILTADELVEIRTHDIQKRIYELERDKVLLKEDDWLNRLSERLQLDARRYRVDIKTGVCLLMKPEDIPNKPETKDGVASPERVPETKPEQVLDKPQT